MPNTVGSGEFSFIATIFGAANNFAKDARRGIACQTAAGQTRSDRKHFIAANTGETDYHRRKCAGKKGCFQGAR